MRSIKSVLVALVAVLAFGAVAASGASAHEYFIEGKSMKELGLKEEAVSGNNGATNVVLETEGVKITCKSANVSGTIKEGGAGTSTVTLTSCTVNEPVNCGIEQPIVFKTTSALGEVAGKLADVFTLNHGTGLFLRFLGSGCPLTVLEGAGQITGLLASEAEQEVATVSINATSGSELEIGGFKWVLRLKESVKLSGANAGKKWAAKK